MALVRERVVVYHNSARRVARVVLVHVYLWTLRLEHVVWWKELVDITVIILEVAIQEANSVVCESASFNRRALA